MRRPKSGEILSQSNRAALEPGDGVKDRRSHQEIASELRYAIAAGKYQPNERLIEEDLAAAFGTNRAVIRAALALLEESQLIIRERNRGARVRALMPDEAREIFEVRAVLEGLIARHAALRADASGIRTLSAIVSGMRKAVKADDLRTYVQLNGEFHRSVADIAKHTSAMKQLEIIHSQSGRYQFRAIVFEGRIQRSLAEHEQIFEAIKARDADEAERLSRAHVENVAEILTKIAVFELTA
jgi:DNA-binding GntR family transcriptional regulator